MKRYEDGHLTSNFLDQDFKKDAIISKPLGRGLALHEKNAGKIYFFAGGTGVYPFSDTIDLLFKDLYI